MNKCILFVELTGHRRSRIEVAFDLSALPQISEFLRAFASSMGWDTAMADRLDAVGEEGLLTLLQDKSEAERGQRRLLLIAYEEDGGAHLEFIAATGEDNIQDRIALLGARGMGNLIEIEQEVSLRLLRHLASSVRHQQYYDTDIVTVRVDRPSS